MIKQTAPFNDVKPSAFLWTDQDDAEYNRLAAEMIEDSKLQFNLFTFGITASTAALGLLATAGAAHSLALDGLPSGLVFLLPLLVLFPTSLVILNRARTRNRKASYIVVNFDYKRLLSDGVTNDTPLQEVRCRPFLPWETALHILERTNRRKNQRVHLAPALKYMAICYATIEMLCIALALFTSGKTDLMASIELGIIIILLSIPAYWYRIRALLWLRSGTSIQGYVIQWLDLKYGENDNSPRYFREWVREFQKTEKGTPGF